MNSLKNADVYSIPAWLVRVLVVLIFAASIALAVWRWQEMQLVSRQMNSVVSQGSRLVNELQELEMRWNPTSAAKTEADYQTTLTLMFSGQEEIANWQAEVQRQARKQRLDNSSHLGTPHPRVTEDQKVSLIRATVDLEPIAAIQGTNSAYRGLLNFAAALRSLPKRTDLIEVSVTGGTNSIAQAQAVLQLWSREGNP